MIPDWLDAETLRSVIIAAITVLGLAAVMVLRFVRRMIVRVALIALLGALALGLWMQRADLQGCIDTCECRLFGQQVAIPTAGNPNCS